jgi:hypothetical protein
VADVPNNGAAIAALVRDGMTILDMAELTGKPPADIKEVLRAVKPLRGVHMRTAVYDTRAAMATLCSEGEGVDPNVIAEHIRSMKPSQLPVSIQSEFWAAQTKRLKYLEEVGDLWRTSAVQKTIAELLKTVRQSMTLLEDNVDQQTALTPRQRDIIRGIADAALAEMRDTVIQTFNGWDGSEDREEDDPSKLEFDSDDL